LPLTRSSNMDGMPPTLQRRRFLTICARKTSSGISSRARDWLLCRRPSLSSHAEILIEAPISSPPHTLLIPESLVSIREREDLPPIPSTPSPCIPYPPALDLTTLPCPLPPIHGLSFPRCLRNLKDRPSYANVPSFFVISSTDAKPVFSHSSLSLSLRLTFSSTWYTACFKIVDIIRKTLI
jgi:hypothetical protein